MLADGHDCFERQILVMRRNIRFDNSVGAPGQQRRNSNTIRIGGHDCHDLAIIAALMGGQTSIADNGELSTCQHLASQSIRITSRVKPLYAAATRPLGSYAYMLFPAALASAARTDRGIWE